MLCEIKKLKIKKKNKDGISFEEFLPGREKITLIKRKKNSVSGEHYHQGLVKSKKPEIWILAQGKIEVYFEDIKSKKSKTIVIQENNLVKIPPKVYHEVKGLTDFILLEFNIQGENCKKDTVENYQKK